MRNVAEGTTPPRPEKKLVQPLTIEEVQKFLSSIRNDRLYPLYVVMLGCGLRRGEALALGWEDIDFDLGIIHVRKNLQWISGQGFIIGEPKSEKSRRDVAIPEFVLEVLKEHLSEKKEDSDYVFCTSKGTPFEPRNIVRHFKASLIKAGLPLETRIHDLRHTFVSFLLAQGTSPKDVQEIAGHSSFGVTMDIYGHLMPQAKKDAAKTINKLFKP